MNYYKSSEGQEMGISARKTPVKNLRGVVDRARKKKMFVENKPFYSLPNTK
jgi:hypothetical protein